MSDAKDPVFDRDGKYLYFTASNDSGPSLQPDVGSFSRPVTRSIYLTVLAKDLPSPFAPESDEEKSVEPPKAELPKADESKPEPRPAAPRTPDVRIDFENIGQRILSMPLPPRSYVGLQVGKPASSLRSRRSRRFPASRRR
jgi:tricorn protease